MPERSQMYTGIATTKRSSSPKPSRRKPPRMRHWKTRDLAFVDLFGHRCYLGKWGSPEADARYAEAIAAWKQRRLIRPARQSAGTVESLCDLHAAWAMNYYVKSGRSTTSGAKVRIVCELLYRAGFGRTPLNEFGPVALARFQAWLAAGGQWARRTVNEYIRVVVDMFRWAVSQELVSPDQHAALRTVRGLRKGRPAATGGKPCREGRVVMPAPRVSVRSIRRMVPPPVRAMMTLQLLTGMRPAEVCAMTPANVRPTHDPKVLVYLVPPEKNKTEHYSIERQVWLGPRSTRVLKLFWPSSPSSGFFSPRRAEADRNAAKRETRRSPRWPSHSRAARRAARGEEPAILGDVYSVDSYRRAITRACEQAGVAAFAPNQLRHSAATSMAFRNDLETAQMMLGHSDSRTTMRYAREAARRKAQRAAARIA